MEERLTYSLAANVNKRNPFVVTRNFHARMSGKESRDEKVTEDRGIARNDAHRKCESRSLDRKRER